MSKNKLDAAPPVQNQPAVVSRESTRSDWRSEQGTIPLFTLGGVSFRVHVVFLAITVVLGIQACTNGTWQQALYLPSALLALAIHEMGHAIMARRRGQTSCKVILHPLIAQPVAARNLRDPKGEAVTALAGPLASALMALMVAAALYAAGRLTMVDLSPMALFSSKIATRFFAFNLYLCAVNLLPSFPLDGGRALRSALAIPWGEIRATQAVGRVTLLWAFVFGITGLHTGSIFVSLLALLFLSGVMRELRESPLLVARRSELKLSDVLEDSAPLSPGMTVGEAARSVFASPRSQYAVVLGGSLLGIVSRQQLLRGNPAAYVSGAMVRQFLCAKESDPLALLVERGLPTYARPVAVTSNGTAQGDFIGLLCAESVQARLMDDAAHLSGTHSSSGARVVSCATDTTDSVSDRSESAK